jgi:hypothetical protein
VWNKFAGPKMVSRAASLGDIFSKDGMNELRMVPAGNEKKPETKKPRPCSGRGFAIAEQLAALSSSG